MKVVQIERVSKAWSREEGSRSASTCSAPCGPPREKERETYQEPPVRHAPDVRMQVHTTFRCNVERVLLDLCDSFFAGRRLVGVFDVVVVRIVVATVGRTLLLGLELVAQIALFEILNVAVSQSLRRLR